VIDVNPSAPSPKTAEDFSLVLGGPLFQIFRRAYLSGSGLELLRRRLIVITAFCWLPLLLLSVAKGTAWGNLVSLPFIHDIDAHARLLISLPLIIAAELTVHQRMRNVIKQFLERGLIPDQARQQFDKAVASANRLRNSVTAELLLVGFVYGVGVLFIWRRFAALEVSSWYGAIENGRLHLSPAGWWFGLVSLPLFQFLLFRWYYRLFIWARFLWQVSRIKLDLLPTHPDRSAGLGFLSNVSFAFVPLLLAQGVLVAGTMANRILYGGAHLIDFKLDIIGAVAFVLLFILGPLLVFSPQLGQVKRNGRREYGALAQRYVREFDTKWLRGGAPMDEAFIGSSDIQSLADLGNSYEVVREMNLVPFSTKTVMQLAVTTVAPMLPLVLTMVPLDELIQRLLKIVF
jgi:hypothetical protein